MPLREMLPVGHDCAQWSVWGTTARVVVTDPAALDDVTASVRAELDAVDAACSRFRTDSELELAGRAGRPVEVSPLLADLVATALRAASITDGDVDPTIGTALRRLGYDRDHADLARTRDGRPATFTVLPTPDWRRVSLRGGVLRIPDGMELDLGATAKARAADRCADIAAALSGVGVLVALGGDIATAGPAPAGGWRVRVQDRPGDPQCTVALPAGAALATSSTVSRQWIRGDDLLHHIVDPRTGRPARRVWRTTSVAAFSCVRANTFSTAAIVRGTAAVDWLRHHGAPARLVGVDGSVRLVGGWPAGDRAGTGSGR